MRQRGQDVGASDGPEGPTNPTPLAEAFYKAWRASGLTYKSIAARAGLSLPTVAAYVNGTRGGGGQRRQRPTIIALARALRMDVNETLALAGLQRDSGSVEALKADGALTRRDRETLIALYEKMRRY